MRILQVSKRDIGGGAASVAWNLFQAYRASGIETWLAVGEKHSDDPHTLLIPNRQCQSNWTKFWTKIQLRLDEYGSIRGTNRCSRGVRFIADPTKWQATYRGIEDFKFPGTQRLLELTPHKPDLVHCHNLHNDYFDLRVLSWLSKQLPVILTLHDAWLLSGHCAYSIDCEKWRSGCGQCPDLSIYPAINRDSTHNNWQRKRTIFSRSRLYLSSPSSWLMERAKESILSPGIVDVRVIHNGIDLSVFRPGQKSEVRRELGIPANASILLFAAEGIRNNRFKDFQTLKKAVEQIAERDKTRQLIFIALGEDAPNEMIGQAEVRFIPYQRDPRIVALYYQAADLYLHAARADTFPNVILEALACGTPVVATAVGGIPEQVKGLKAVVETPDPLNHYDLDEATGVLVSAGDAQGMAEAIETLLDDLPLRNRMSKNAAADASVRFDLQRQIDDYLNWYSRIATRDTDAKL